MLWNGFIALFYDAYLIFTLCAIINMKIDSDPVHALEGLNLGVSWIFFIVISIMFPLFVIIFYTRNYENFYDRKF